jgi:hypothetical protein
VEGEQARVQFYYGVWSPWWLERRQHPTGKRWQINELEKKTMKLKS